MIKVIGQRYEVYDYRQVKDAVLRRGETINVKDTPGYGAAAVTLLGNGKKTVGELYQDWNNGEGSPFRPAADQDVIDNDNLEAAKEYANQEIIKNKLAVNEWLAPVKTVGQIPAAGLDNTRNYLIKVVADTEKSGVYQAIAGWADEPAWVLYDDTVDFVDEQELQTAVREHNEDWAAHNDIRQAFAEADQNLQAQINRLLPEGIENLPELLAQTVKLTGDQTIAGTKTFSTSPEVPSKSTAAENNPATVATEAQVALKANLVSPAFAGAPTAPTAPITQSSLATAKNIVNMEMLVNLLFPVGHAYTQGPNDPTPVEAGYPGNWQDWTQRAELYGLSTVNPSAYRAYESNLTNVTAGEHILWNVPNTGRFMVVRAKAAMAAVPAVLNPIDWRFPEDGETNYGRSIFYAERRKVQPGDSAWLDSDKAFCDEVLGNNAIPGTTSGTTYYVHELITCAGLFPSFEGGNRPPFVSGVALDRIRNITGQAYSVRMHNENSTVGAISHSYLYSQGGTSGSGTYAGSLYLNSSLVVPTGEENSPVTLSMRKWRRVG